jgi:hypothetical protein
MDAGAKSLEDGPSVVFSFATPLIQIHLSGHSVTLASQVRIERDAFERWNG